MIHYSTYCSSAVIENNANRGSTPSIMTLCLLLSIHKITKYFCLQGMMELPSCMLNIVQKADGHQKQMVLIKSTLTKAVYCTHLLLRMEETCFIKKSL